MIPSFDICDHCIRQHYQKGMSGVTTSHYCDKTGHQYHEVRKAKWKIYHYLSGTLKTCVCPMQYDAVMELDELVVPEDCPYQAEHVVSS